ncbi:MULTISPECIES: type IV pilin protein [Thalassotalea]|uniref:type IV pilin protein n=1 Tax=Thalassotalea TaxID=1518149 RepID=UPI00094340DC|nr:MULTISPECIES: type IV pilin protein [Thalassotalea]OKY25752.1 prepilin-type N-terminal cleavage/methylation domain-containing protein [Thalassotalea sp. PP2-459]
MRKYVKQKQGFTIIELLLVVAIIGILAAVAYPSYNSFVLQGNRSEGQRELLRLANLQEQVYVDTRAYTADMTDLGMSADPFITENGNYSIDATVAGDTFILTATAKSTQVNDTACKIMTINEVGVKTPTSGCWEK